MFWCSILLWFAMDIDRLHVTKRLGVRFHLILFVVSSSGNGWFSNGEITADYNNFKTKQTRKNKGWHFDTLCWHGVIVDHLEHHIHSWGLTFHGHSPAPAAKLPAIWNSWIFSLHTLYLSLFSRPFGGIPAFRFVRKWWELLQNPLDDDI